MNRTNIINLIAKRIDARSYLQIGGGATTGNFNSIAVSAKIHVDPAGHVHDHRVCPVTSAGFWEDNTLSWDLILIDGDHQFQAVKYDIHHAAACLSPGGVMVIRGVLPISAGEGAADRPSVKAVWCGEVWRAWGELRAWGYANGHVTFAIDSDHGLGIVYGADDHWCDDADLWRDDEAEAIGEIEHLAPWVDRSTYGVVSAADAEREINQIPRIDRAEAELDIGGEL